MFNNFKFIFLIILFVFQVSCVRYTKFVSTGLTMPYANVEPYIVSNHLGYQEDDILLFANFNEFYFIHGSDLEGGGYGRVYFCMNKIDEIVINNVSLKSNKILNLTWSEPVKLKYNESYMTPVHEERKMYCLNKQIAPWESDEFKPYKRGSEMYEQKMAEFETKLWDSNRLYLDVYYTRNGSEEQKASFEFKKKTGGYLKGYY